MQTLNWCQHHGKVEYFMISNPILRGFHPDPSIVYADGIFYIANSTFEYFPGISISSSKDLMNWKKVSSPLSSEDLLDLRGVPRSGGIWAPCLTYSGGYFYLVFTNVKSWSDGPFKDTPNFVTRSRNIEGPWSTPVYLNSSGFDPSLFHDADGKKYIVNMEWDYREDGPGHFTGILLTEINPDTFECIGEARKIFTGSERGLTEGPHLYQRGGYYYLLTAEGGTSYDHAVTAARSKHIGGPYELHPNTHLISSKGIPESRLQKAGHGSLCQSGDGRWWLAFLCGRPVDQSMSCILGRETAITDIIWEDGWPYLPDKSLSPPARARELHGSAESNQKPVDISYDFTCEDFRSDFMSLRVPAKYEIFEGNTLRLYGRESMVSRHFQNMLVRRQTAFHFEAVTCVSVSRKNFQVMAGLLYRYDEENQYYLRIAYDEKADDFMLGILAFDRGKFSLPMGKKEIRVGSGPVRLRLAVRGIEGRFSYSTENGGWTDIKLNGELYTIDARRISDEYTRDGGFTGAFVGMSCQDLEYARSYADFHCFEYREFEAD